jgi:lipopolysaccharide assembly outer membrane protein LptD (OstA)
MIFCDCKASDSIDISSEEVFIDTKNNICKFNRNAKVSYLYQTDQYTLKADKIVVSYEKKDIKKIEASGNVVFTYDRIQISAKTCSFDLKNVSFSGEIIISDNKIGIIKADKAVYNIESKKIDITSENKVNLVIKSKKI